MRTVLTPTYPTAPRRPRPPPPSSGTTTFSSPATPMKPVHHPGLPVADLVLKPPRRRDRAVGIDPDPAVVVEFVLEASGAFEGEPPVRDATRVSVALLGEGPVVAVADH